VGQPGCGNMEPMGHYPFTMFNGATVVALTMAVVVVWGRFRGAYGANWPLVCYAVMVGYTIGFQGGLNPYWMTAAGVCALAIRFGLYPRQVRWAEALALGYVAWRCMNLLLMW
jgi:hypothetical protein